MKINLQQLDQAWDEFSKLNNQKEASFVEYLKAKFDYSFDTIIDIKNQETVYKMIYNRLKPLVPDSVLEKRKRVVQCWYELNNHQNFLYNKEMEYKSPVFLIDPMMVNSEGVVDDDPTQNVFLHYWYEILVPTKLDKSIESYQWHYGGKDKIPNVDLFHDYTIDGGGETYEDCIINMHKAFTEKYGEFKEIDYGTWNLLLND